MKNIVIQHKGVYVAGFSLKTQKVYFTKDFQDALKFDSKGANDFIADHANRKQGFSTANITIQIIKRGIPFNPHAI